MKRNAFFTIAFILLWLPMSIAQLDSSWNSTNTNGQKEGKWRAYHENGMLRYVGQFKEGQPEGEFKYFFNSGDLQSVLNFETPKVANARLFYQSGDLMAEGKYINQKKDGLWISYGGSNIKLEEGAYVSGLKEGEWKTYFASGLVSAVSQYENDLQIGEYKSYYENGKLKQESLYANGKLHGLSTFYKSTGKKYLKGIYLNGMRDKRWIYYEDNMKVEKVLEYQEGVLLNPELLDTINYDSDPYKQNIKDVLEFDDLRGKIKYE